MSRCVLNSQMRTGQKFIKSSRERNPMIYSQQEEAVVVPKEEVISLESSIPINQEPPTKVKLPTEIKERIQKTRLKRNIKF